MNTKMTSEWWITNETLVAPIFWAAYLHYRNEVVYPYIKELGNELFEKNILEGQTLKNNFFTLSQLKIVDFFCLNRPMESIMRRSGKILSYTSH